MNKELKVKIKLKSVFLFIDILKKMDIDFNDLESISVGSENNEDNTEKVGKELIKLLVNGLDKAENEVYLFLSNILGISEEKVQELELFEQLTPVLKEYKGWQGFLGKLQPLTQNITQ